MSRARRRMKSTTDGSSITGSVSGCTTMEVTPPAAAARAADFSVSLVSAPGSPVLTRRSTRPGAEHGAAARRPLDIGRQAVYGRPLTHLGDQALGDDQRRQARRSRSPDRPGARRRRRSDEPAAHQSLSSRAARRGQHRHAHGHAHLDLVLDQADGRGRRRRRSRSRRRGSSGPGASPARPARRGPASRGPGPRSGNIRASRGRARRACARAAGAASSPRRRRRCRGEVVEHLDAPALRAGRHQGRRPDQAHARAQHGAAGRRSSAPRGCAGRRRRWPRSGRRPSPNARRMESASSSAWVGCSCWPSPALMTLQLDLLRQQRRGARRAVADDQDVRLHGVQGHGGVDQGLALGDRGGPRAHVDHVGAQPLAGQLEGALGAGRILEEKVDQRPALEQVELLGPLAVQRHEAVGQIEQLAQPATGSRSVAERKCRRGKGNGPRADLVDARGDRGH